MMKTLLFFFFTFFFFTAFAQSGRGSLTFFSDQGAAFIVYINGVQQNKGPQSRVTISGLTQPFYHVKIDFINSRNQSFEKKNVTAADGDERMMSVSYKVRTEQTGKSRLVFYSMLPPSSSKINQETVLKGSTQPDVLINPSDGKPEVSSNEKKATEKKAILSNVSGATISINSNKDLNKAIAKRQDEPKKNEPQKHVEEKRVTNKETVTQQPVKTEKPLTQEKRAEEKPKPDATAAKQGEEVIAPDKKPNAVIERKCNDWPMMTEEFENAKKPILDANTDEKRLAKAKEMAADNCLLVSQISQVASLFSLEKNKLNFVTLAYSATIDKPNFHRLRKLFKDEGIIKQFDSFMKAK
ncbi:MAG: DUF4476 domain-containing protein [Ferruginibacter sp.]|nr:DUF4476 domain-containing protein [Ferruginibacter sp.]